MKYLITTVILWAGILLPNSTAQDLDLYIENAYNQIFSPNQNTLGDTLNIFNQDELFITIGTSDIQKLKHSADIYNLISDFKTNLSSVINQVPRYDIFTITYIKNQSLKVEEVKGIVKYQVKNSEMVKAHNQSTVHLLTENLHVIFYVNELEDLQTRNYNSMIKSAFAKVKRGANFRQKINSPRNEFFYSYSKGKLVDGYEKVKFANRFSLVIGGTIGFFKSNPVYEINTGLGYNFGVKNKRMAYLFLGQLYQYNSDLERPEMANIYGVGFKPNKRGSISFGLVQTEDFKTLESETRFDDLKYRLTFTGYPTKGVSVSGHFYFGDFFDDDSIDAFPSISFGFGF